MLAVGQSLPFRRGGSVSLPLDVSRTLEDLLENAALDVVHVHEPFAPSAASAALRHSRALNVGTFHSPTERFVSTQVARPLVELLFGRLDGRSASFAATRDLVERFFPGGYDVIRPGADLLEPARDGGPPHIVFPVREERGALRIFLRALRRMDTDRDWRATVWFPDTAGASSPPALSRRLRDRVRFAGPADGDEASHLASRRRGGGGVQRHRAGAPAGAARAGRRGRPGGLAAAALRGVAGRRRAGADVRAPRRADPGRPAGPPGGRPRAAGALPRARRRRAARAGVERRGRPLRRAVRGHRRPAATTPPGKPAVRKRVAGRELISVDLHMHTDHSSDCATPTDQLLAAARDAGLGAIAVTDHNEVSGAHEAREKAERYGVKVIVAEEVKTADQGEVIGLFIEDKIPRGMTLQETIAAIRDQNGLVYVPHPFDRMHSVPDYEHLLDVVEDIDAIEVFNPRVAFSSFNEEAERFAAKYRIVAGAGSDSHVAAGLGSVKIRMRDFDGPEEFLESLRDADIVRKKTSLLYVQALKFIQTKATPENARRRTARPGAGQARAGTGKD